jgi:hypothetical protein
MPYTIDSDIMRSVETMLRKEMDRNGHIMVRSLDKIHAATGLAYTKISEMAERLREKDRCHGTA